MLCDICKKREATIHIKEVKNGKCVSTNLCTECAKEKELAGGLGAFGFNLAEVIFNVGKMSEADKKADASEDKNNKEVREKESSLICPECGWNLAKMRRSGGKLGCSRCYTVFAKWVSMAVEQVQRSSVHVGKRPEKCGRSANAVKLEMDKLQLELASAVSADEYERAAQLRDRINALKAEAAALQDATGEK